MASILIICDVMMPGLPADPRAAARDECHPVYQSFHPSNAPQSSRAACRTRSLLLSITGTCHPARANARAMSAPMRQAPQRR